MNVVRSTTASNRNPVLFGVRTDRLAGRVLSEKIFAIRRVLRGPRLRQVFHRQCPRCLQTSRIRTCHFSMHIMVRGAGGDLNRTQVRFPFFIYIQKVVVRVTPKQKQEITRRKGVPNVQT